MMFKILTTTTTLFLWSSPSIMGVNAQFMRGGFGGGGGFGGPPRNITGNATFGGFGGSGPHHNHTGNATFGGGPPDGGFFGGCGGDGPAGPGGPMGNVTHVNLTCAADASQPECPTGPFGVDSGVAAVWVCRQGFDRETGGEESFSICVPADHGHDTDVCGCCDGVCPEVCECTCDLFEEGDGLGVLVVDADDAEELCVEDFRAMRMVTRGDQFTCKTECDAN